MGRLDRADAQQLIERGHQQDRMQHEAGGFAKRSDQQSADRRADEACGIKCARMQRHRVGQELAIGYQVAEEGMTYRNFAGKGDAPQRGHHQQNIGIDMAGGGQQREQCAEQCHRR